MALTAKQEMFCKEYLIDLNATQAAIRAGYSEKTAHAIGHENLSKPDIQEALAKFKEERNERVNVDADWVLKESVDAFKRLRDKNEYTTAKGYLEMAGKHITVQAFKEKVEHGNSQENPLPSIELVVKSSEG